MNNIYDKIKKAKIISINFVCLLTPISLVFFLSNMLNLGLFTLYIDGIGVFILKMSDIVLENKNNSNSKTIDGNIDLNNNKEIELSKIESKEKNMNYTFVSENYTVMSSSKIVTCKIKKVLEDTILDRPITLDSSFNGEKSKAKQKVKVLKRTLK